jgi:hypothetical protein
MVGCYRKDDRDGEVVDDRTEAAGKGASAVPPVAASD